MIGSNINARDDYFVNFCHPDNPEAAQGGPDTVYSFTAPTGAPIAITLSAPFNGSMYLLKGNCETQAREIDINSFQGCSTAEANQHVIQVNQQAGGTYYLVVEGRGEGDWGQYQLTISFE